jgi:hypothetical protein
MMMMMMMMVSGSDYRIQFDMKQSEGTEAVFCISASPFNP